MIEIKHQDVEDWINFIAMNYSGQTFYTYVSAFKNYFKWVSDRYGKAYFPNWRMIQQWLDTLKANGFSDMSRHTYYRALKNFLKYHGFDDVIAEFEKRGVVPRARITRTETLTPKQIEELIKKADSIRDKLIIRLLFVCGLRISELVNLKLSDYDPKNKTLRILVKKKRGGVEYYTHKLDYLTAKMIEAWIKIKPESPWLFPGRNPSKPLTPRMVRYILADLGRRVLKKHIWPHVIRHSVGSLLAKKGYPAQYIAIYIRDTLPATERYIHLSPEEITTKIVKEMFEKSQEEERSE